MKPDTAVWRMLLWRAAAVFAIAVAATCCYGVLRQDAEAQRRTCVSNLKQLSLGALMYVQDYDERYPPMKFASQTHERLYPYIRNRGIYTCPATRADYVPNPALNYVFAKKIAGPASTVQFCDAKPHTADAGGRSWGVAYADGHVMTIDTEPRLGKPGPTPAPPTHAQRVRDELSQLQRIRADLDRRLRLLEAEQRRLKGKR